MLFCNHNLSYFWVSSIGKQQNDSAEPSKHMDAIAVYAIGCKFHLSFAAKARHPHVALHSKVCQPAGSETGDMNLSKSSCKVWRWIEDKGLKRYQFRTQTSILIHWGWGILEAAGCLVCCNKSRVRTILVCWMILMCNQSTKQIWSTHSSLTAGFQPEAYSIVWFW